MRSTEAKGYLHFYNLGRTAAEQGAAAEVPADLGARDRDAWLLGHRDATCSTCKTRHAPGQCFYGDYLAALGPVASTLTPAEDRILRWLAGWDASTRDAIVSILTKARVAAATDDDVMAYIAERRRLDPALAAGLDKARDERDAVRAAQKAVR